MASLNLITMDADINIKPTGEVLFVILGNIWGLKKKPVNWSDIAIDCNKISHTEKGKLMARYCVAFDTVRQFSGVTGTEILPELVRKHQESF